MAALVNVTEVFEAWLDHRKRRVGPVATDGNVVTSYGMPLLARGPGPRYFLAERKKGGYTQTTATHLWSLHQLVDGSGIDPDLVFRIPVVDVGCAACGGAAAEEVVIRHVDAVHGKFSRNPNPTPKENPRVNVEQVFDAWLAGKSKTVGPVSTDGATIKSYAMPLLTRQGNRIFLARQRLNVSKIGSRWQPVDRLDRIVSDDLINADGQGYSTKAGATEAARSTGYSMTTTQHLSSLHELVRRSHMEDVLEVAAEDVKRATWGDGSLEEVIIKYVDIPGGRIGKGNPAGTPPTSSQRRDPQIEHVCKRCAHRRDPRVHETCPNCGGIGWDPGKRMNPASTPEDAERLFRELVMDPDPAAMLVAEDIVTGNGLMLSALGERWVKDDPPIWDTTNQLATVRSVGYFRLSRDTAQPLNLGWTVYQIMGAQYEIEIVYDFLGRQSIPDDPFDGYTAAVGHTTYFRTLKAAVRAAAADAWDAAKTLKDLATQEPLPTVEFVRRQINQTIVDPTVHNTPPAVFSGKRTERKRSQHERYVKSKKNPATDSPIDDRLAELGAAENPQQAGPPSRKTSGWWILTWRSGGRTETSRQPGRTAAGAFATLAFMDGVELLHARPALAADLGALDPDVDEAQAFDQGWKRNPRSVFETPRWKDARAKLQGAAVPPKKNSSPPQTKTKHDEVHDEAHQVGMACPLCGKRPPKKNPGELDAVTTEITSQIVYGVSNVLWRHTYEEWHAENDANDYGRDEQRTTHQSMQAALELVVKICEAEEVRSIVDLYALVMQIDTGNEFEYVVETVKPRLEPEYFSEFANNVVHGLRRDKVTEVSKETWDTLDEGDTPENEWYWEAWEDLMRDAVITDDAGQKWHISQHENGIFLVPDGMGWDDAADWWAWEEPEPLPLAGQFGQALAHMALGDGESWFDNHKQKSDDGRMEWKPAIPHIDVTFDGDELGWSFNGGVWQQAAQHRVRVTFEEITPGAEDGDEHEVESGWEDEDGAVMEEYVRDDDDEPIVAATARFILHGGHVEASTSPGWHKGVWYSQTDSAQGRDYFERGIERRLSYHLDGFTEEEERAVYNEIQRIQGRR